MLARIQYNDTLELNFVKKIGKAIANLTVRLHWLANSQSCGPSSFHAIKYCGGVGGHLVVGMVGLLLSQNLLRSVSSALDVHLDWHHRGQNTCWPVLVGEHCFTGVLPGFSLCRSGCVSVTSVKNIKFWWPWKLSAKACREMPWC